MKKNKIGKIIGFIGICLFIAGVSYVLTQYLDKNLYLNTELLVTLEDSKEFNLESTEKLTKEEALKIYPNTFKVENKSLKSVKYTVSIKEIKNDLEKDDLSYVLYLNDKEVRDGKISELNNNILYESTVISKKIDTYKLYLYLTSQKDEPIYTYSIVVNAK